MRHINIWCRPFGKLSSFFKHYGPSELGITQKNIALEGYIWRVLGAAVTPLVAFWKRCLTSLGLRFFSYKDEAEDGCDFCNFYWKTSNKLLQQSRTILPKLPEAKPWEKKGASCNQEMSYSFIFQTECFELVQYFSQPVKNLFYSKTNL